MLPHRRQPTRLPRPWDSSGKNTGVGCHFLLQCMKVKSESEVAQSCLTLHNPMDCSPPGSSVHGIFQARVLDWGAIAFPVFTLGTSYSRDCICLCTCKPTLKDNGLSNFYRNFIFKELTYTEVIWLSHRTNIALTELNVPL